MSEIEIISSSISKKFNYVYLITEISSNRKYIGVRSCDISIENDLGKIYKSSSSDLDFINRQKVNKNDYTYTLLSNYDNRIEANIEEVRLHNLYDVDINPEYFNIIKATLNKFCPIGMVVTKDIHGTIFYVSVNDPRYLSGELVSIIKGKVVVVNKDGIISQVDKDDPRYLSGELVSINVGKIVVKDIHGNHFKVSMDDPRYLSGELIHMSYGLVSVKDIHGNHFKVDKDNHRYLSGELIHNMVGTKHTDEHKSNISKSITGDKNPFYGKVHSEEVLDMISNFYSIEGKTYRGRNEIASLYDIHIKTVANRCKSDKWPEWKLIKERV